MRTSGQLKWGLVVAIPISLGASPIPTYEISSANSAEIELTDLAVVNLFGTEWNNFSLWENGDLLQFAHKEDNFRLPMFNIDGLPKIEPLFTFYNLTKDLSTDGYFAFPPQLAYVTVLATDPLAGTITLSDTSVWIVRPIDRRFFASWEAGDIVMVGHNRSPDCPVYDGAISNAVHYQVAHAHIQ